MIERILNEEKLRLLTKFFIVIVLIITSIIAYFKDKKVDSLQDKIIQLQEVRIKEMNDEVLYLRNSGTDSRRITLKVLKDTTE